MKRFKIRASQVGVLMSGSSELTDKQLDKLKEYEEREKGTFKDNPKLTLSDAMKKAKTELLELQEQKKNELPQGAKTYIETWVKDWLYNKKSGQFSSKYTDKGNLTEEDAIAFFIEQFPEYGWGTKNEDWFKNHWTHGTPDLLVDIVVDIKSSFTHSTFPLFDNDKLPSLYEWQVRSYMWLTRKENAIVSFCLMDMPEELLWDFVRRAKYEKKNEGKLEDEIYDELKELYTYSDLDPALRIRNFHVKRCKEKEEQIKHRVELANKYALSIIPERIKKLLGKKSIERVKLAA